ncbi:rhamnulokinase [Aeoliella sp.]|uniref:rhamnulokinase n=1 Tax=Aeoliella sp. TaxID=2795800 RepID=UPI003CCC33B5
MTHHYIACDLGAESGRVILGTLEGDRLSLDEVHRFANHAVRIAGTMRWNILGIFEQLKEGLRQIAQRGVQPAGVSVDSWGVDYVWLGDGQPMLTLPHHYRDPRTNTTYEAAQQSIGRETIFAETGIQFMPLNTIYQLLADVQQSPQVLQVATQFLPIADYLNYLFSDVAKCEVSLASTTQMYNPATGDWSTKLIEACGLRRDAFPELAGSGTKLGPLTAELQDETGLNTTQVIATCSHDTGAAVAAVPAEGDDWAYLSSGTWSLIGVELPQPLVNDTAREENFTNEVGYGGTIRFLKNIIGLWLLQECRRAWQREGQTLDYAELNNLAAEAEPFRSLINPNDPRFLQPEHMPTAITTFCQETGQAAPETPGQFARCILESLSLMYGQMLKTLQTLTGREIRKLHIVGGGSQSKLLNQFAADATGRTVLAGPVEATAIGNLLIQAIALGQLDDLSALRRVVRSSFGIETYEPSNREAWSAAQARFAALPTAR